MSLIYTDQIVITSYSIHYTKLYEYFLSKPERQNGLLVPIWELALAEGYDTTDALSVLRTRITSYNVCYTKLLRFGLQWHKQPFMVNKFSAIVGSDCVDVRLVGRQQTDDHIINYLV